jgi:nucleotide-binding universal stress UspA family protein
MKPTLDHVLVATDFSASASAAVDYAATLARRAGARLHLVHVLEEPFVTSGPYQWHMPDTPARREGRYQQALARLSKDAAAVSKAALTPTIEVRCGEVTRSIVEAAIDYGADVIVLGTRGRAGLRHLFGRGTAERLQRLAGRPIMMVRDADDRREWPAHAHRGAA